MAKKTIDDMGFSGNELMAAGAKSFVSSRLYLDLISARFIYESNGNGEYYLHSVLEKSKN